MAVSILTSGSGPGQWGDQLRTALRQDFAECHVALVSASLDGWAVEMLMPDRLESEVEAFVGRLGSYLESEPDPWDVNIVVSRC